MNEDGETETRVRTQLDEGRSGQVPGVAVVPPDLGALYLRHRDAMRGVAASVLREAGLADTAGDAVHEAIVSIMKSPPGDVRDWGTPSEGHRAVPGTSRIGNRGIRQAVC